MTTAHAEMVAPNMHAEAEVLTYYARRAKTYDRLTSYEMAHHREAIRLADIQDGNRVLEVACGTGRATVELARQVGPHGKLDAVDLSDAMRQHAQQKFRRLAYLIEWTSNRGTPISFPTPIRHSTWCTTPTCST